MTLPLTKPADLAGDATDLLPFYSIIDRYPDALEGQHPIRRWEYAMALYAIRAWQAGRVRLQEVPVGGLQPPVICDVGGAGSNFWRVLTSLTSEDIQIIDPHAPQMVADLGQRQMFSGGVEEYAASDQHMHGQFDILTCISVIEHVIELRAFFRACRMLLKPGGLLFLTTDYWDAEGPDTAHFHWMRHRIYNKDSMQRLLASVRELGYARFVDTPSWDYPGPQVYDYSVCSLALVRREL